MKILVDGDACPVKETILAIAREKDIRVVFVVSTASYFDRGWNAEKVLVDALPQAVDIAIINRVEPGDIVVTQDYGLASLVLGKQGKAISPRGRIFTNDNIDRLLFQRQLHHHARKSGERVRGAKKRSKKEEQRFSQNFQRLLDELFPGH